MVRYKDTSQLIGRDVEDRGWQQLAIEGFFQDDEADHA